MPATVFEQQGDVLTAKPGGRLDTVTSPVFESEVRSRMDGAREVILDFAKVEYISSGGLRAVLSLDQQAESEGGSLKLIHVNEHIIEIFELVGFTELITVERD